MVNVGENRAEVDSRAEVEGHAEGRAEGRAESRAEAERRAEVESRAEAESRAEVESLIGSRHSHIGDHDMVHIGSSANEGGSDRAVIDDFENRYTDPDGS